jgi:hypothetical protein
MMVYNRRDKNQHNYTPYSYLYLGKIWTYLGTDHFIFSNQVNGEFLNKFWKENAAMLTPMWYSQIFRM